ncbi:MAG: helix-turn-helix transcriptional regulator [Lachnospiraceae bacterium]|nr:helix-turn-helix transcriptional regulator [Lachnospiraceae bacterium]
MGKRSVKENKTVYQQYREAQELTRDKASERMDFLSADRIEKIENERSLPHPDEILAMAKAYQAPELSNYYCSNACPIGRKYVPELKPKELSTIVLELLASITSLGNEKNRLVEITVDGEISEDEQEDFARIREELQKLTACSSALSFWLEKQELAKNKN